MLQDSITLIEASRRVKAGKRLPKSSVPPGARWRIDHPWDQDAVLGIDFPPQGQRLKHREFREWRAKMVSNLLVLDALAGLQWGWPNGTITSNMLWLREKVILTLNSARSA